MSYDDHEQTRADDASKCVRFPDASLSHGNGRMLPQHISPVYT